MKQLVLKFLKAWRVAVNAWRLTWRYDRNRIIAGGRRGKAADAWSWAAIACMVAHNTTRDLVNTVQSTDKADQKAIDACLEAGLLGDQWRRKEPGYVPQWPGKEATSV